jgi:hypothetical protein
LEENEVYSGNVEMIAISDFSEVSVSVCLSAGQISPSPIITDAQIVNESNVSLLFW